MADSLNDDSEGYVALWTKGPRATKDHLNDMVNQGNDHEDRISAIENADQKSSPFILDFCMNGAPAQLQVSGMIVTT